MLTAPLRHALLAIAALAACARTDAPAGADSTSEGTSGAPASTGDGPGTTTAEAGSSSGGGGEGSTTGDGDGGDDRIHITHAFGPIDLPPTSDDVSMCTSWTLDNAKPVYVNEVEMANLGAFHHSNWFVVPEDKFEGPDGYWPCADRGFDEINASAQGAVVLFAQSTQSYTENQRLAEGSVVKIPERYKVVATLHTLNASPEPTQTSLWLTLYPIHPKDVTTVVTALSIQYKDLHIPALSEARFTANCDLGTPYWLSQGEPLAMRLHYILPHYHYLGNHFEVKVQGGLRDGEVVYSLDGFNGTANGLTFDPPLDLPGATGLSVTCGYDNWRSEDIEWGNGGGEMCVMLALIDSNATMGASVDLGNHLVDVQDGVQMYEGVCLGIALDKNPDQSMPDMTEVLAPLYLPPVDPDDQGVPPVPACQDSNPAVQPAGEATLSRVRDNVLVPYCTYSSCHGVSGAADLDLSATDLHGELMDHEVVADVSLPLVEPGDPEGSHLYQRLARCEAVDDAGHPLSHMPYNAPFLLDDELVALVRTWIEDGAQDN